MLDFGFYNMDCMDGMREYPDNYFDLAIVDPPYGGGFADGGGCQGWFSKYHQSEDPDKIGGARSSIGIGLAVGSTSTKRTHYTFGYRKSDKNYEQKRKQAEEMRKKS